MEQEIQKSFIDSITIYIQLIFIIVQGVAAPILAVLTYLYLKETRKTREISEKALKAEWSVNLNTDISSLEPEVTRNKDRITIFNEYTITNTGTMQVETLTIERSLHIGDGITTETKEVEKLSSSYTHSFEFTLPFDKRDLEMLPSIKSGEGSLGRLYTQFPEIKVYFSLGYRNVSNEYETSKEVYEYKFNQWQKLS